MQVRVHHTAICVTDPDASLRFYRDGLGMQVTMEDTFDGPWRQLFDGPSDRLHMTFLGDPDHPEAGTIELVRYRDGDPEPSLPAVQRYGFMLVSLYVDVDATLERLASIGFPDHERVELETPHGRLAMASVRDPDGVLIELIDAGVGAQVTG
jgi:catechol 2,3-dioxygenase-like lactoylglutathione lyase family enzyme